MKRWFTRNFNLTSDDWIARNVMEIYDRFVAAGKTGKSTKPLSKARFEYFKSHLPPAERKIFERAWRFGGTAEAQRMSRGIADHEKYWKAKDEAERDAKAARKRAAQRAEAAAARHERQAESDARNAAKEKAEEEKHQRRRAEKEADRERAEARREAEEARKAEAARRKQREKEEAAEEKKRAAAAARAAKWAAKNTWAGRKAQGEAAMSRGVIADFFGRGESKDAELELIREQGGLDAVTAAGVQHTRRTEATRLFGGLIRMPKSLEKMLVESKLSTKTLRMISKGISGIPSALIHGAVWTMKNSASMSRALVPTAAHVRPSVNAISRPPDEFVDMMMKAGVGSEEEMQAQWDALRKRYALPMRVLPALMSAIGPTADMAEPEIAAAIYDRLGLSPDVVKAFAILQGRAKPNKAQSVAAKRGMAKFLHTMEEAGTLGFFANASLVARNAIEWANDWEKWDTDDMTTEEVAEWRARVLRRIKGHPEETDLHDVSQVIRDDIRARRNALPYNEMMNPALSRPGMLPMIVNGYRSSFGEEGAGGKAGGKTYNVHIDNVNVKEAGDFKEDVQSTCDALGGGSSL